MLLMARRIANLTDARYFAAKEVHYLAFNLTPGTPGYLDPVYMQAMREWIQGPKILGEFGADTSIHFIREAATFYKLDGVILPNNIELPVWDNIEVWVSIGANYLPEQPSSEVSGYIIEWPINAVSDEWRERSIVQYEGALEQLATFLDEGAWLGLSMAGGAEEQVGVKSFDDIETIFEYLHPENDD
jgi:phosphoribosylanthranilate isomerase